MSSIAKTKSVGSSGRKNRGEIFWRIFYTVLLGLLAFTDYHGGNVDPVYLDAVRLDEA